MHDVPTTMIEPSKSDPKVSTTWIISAMSIGLLVTIVLLSDAFFHATAQREERRKAESASYWQFERNESAQREILTDWELLDEAGGRVSMPIDEAIRRVVAEQGQ